MNMQERVLEVLFSHGPMQKAAIPHYIQDITNHQLDTALKDLKGKELAWYSDINWGAKAKGIEDLVIRNLWNKGLTVV